MTELMTDKTPDRDWFIRFGRYRGKTLGWIADNDQTYLRWITLSGVATGRMLAAALALLEGPQDGAGHDTTA